MLKPTDNITIEMDREDESKYIEDYNDGRLADEYPAIQFRLSIGRDWPPEGKEGKMNTMPPPTVAGYKWGSGYHILFMIDVGRHMVYRAVQLDADDKDDLREFLMTLLDAMDEDFHGIENVEDFDGQMGYESVKEDVQSKVASLVAQANSSTDGE